MKKEPLVNLAKEIFHLLQPHFNCQMMKVVLLGNATVGKMRSELLFALQLTMILLKMVR